MRNDILCVILQDDRETTDHFLEFCAERRIEVHGAQRIYVMLPRHAPKLLSDYSGDGRCGSLMQLIEKFPENTMLAEILDAAREHFYPLE